MEACKRISREPRDRLSQLPRPVACSPATASGFGRYFRGQPQQTKAGPVSNLPDADNDPESDKKLRCEQPGFPRQSIKREAATTSAPGGLGPVDRDGSRRVRLTRAHGR